MDWLDFELDERSFCYVLYSKNKGELSARCYMADEVKEIKAFEKTLLNDIIRILPSLNKLKSKRRIYVAFSNRHAAFFGEKQSTLKTIEFTYSLQSELNVIKKFVLSEKLKRLCKFLFLKERERLIIKSEGYYELGSLSDCEEYTDEDTLSCDMNILRRKDDNKLSNNLSVQLDDPSIIHTESTEITELNNDKPNNDMKICDESHISYESIRQSLFNECKMIIKHSKAKYVIYKCVYFDCSPVVFFRSHIKLAIENEALRYNEDYYHDDTDYNFNKFIPTFDKRKLI